MHHSVFSSILFVSGAISAGIAISAWNRRYVTGSRHLALLMAAVSLWSIAVGHESLATDVSTKIICSQIEYIGYGFTGALFLLFVYQYTRQGHMLTPRLKASLFVVPLITVALAWTNSRHWLLWSGFTYIEATNILVYHRGPWFWIFAGYTYLLSFFSIAVLARAYATVGNFQKRLYAMIILGAAFPLLTGALYLLGWAPTRGMGITPLGFAATGVVMFWGLHRRQLLGLIPVGRAMLVEHMSDGVVVLDNNDRIADINPAALHHLSAPPVSPEGHSITSAFADVPGIITLLKGTAEGRGEIHLPGEPTRYLEVRISPIRSSRRQQGRLVTLRDITGQKEAAHERERIIGELQEALAHIQTLHGLLPICSVCKKIRNEDGSWQHIETYIRDHTGAEFSHGYCPECAMEYYNGMFKPK